MRQIQCLLFDNDGTLVESEWLCNHAISLKFRDLGVELSTGDLLLEYRGWKLANIFGELARKHNVQIPESFVREYRSIVAQLFTRDLKPVRGIVTALDELPHPKAVVSNGPRQKIRQSLELCGLTNYFSNNTFSAYDVGAFKPDPALYHHCAIAMGFSPANCAVIEDSLTGVEAGVKARMPVFFYNRYNDRCPFNDVIQFQDMRELPALIAKNS